MKKYLLELRINGVTKADTNTETHRAALFGWAGSNLRTSHNVTIDGLPPDMARVFGGAYAKPNGVRVTIEVCGPDEEF